MLRSLFSGITGLRAHQTLMDVVSNNISNVNTTGFKSSSAVFEDTLTQTLSAAGSPTSLTGGVNPKQVGLGVQLAAVNTNFTQGSVQSTGTATDLMIQGDGFFILNNAGETQYSRNGAFKFDANGSLVTSDGAFVQGWMVGADGTINTDTSVGNITVPAGQLMSPLASTSVTVTGNISAVAMATDSSGNLVPQVITLGPTVYDPTGAAHVLSVVLKQDTSDATGNTWTVDVYDTSVAGYDPTTATPLTTGTLTYDGATGKYSSGSPVTFDITAADGTTTTTIDLNLDGTSRYGGTKSIAVTGSTGYPAGGLTQFQIGEDGSVVGIFSNSQKQVLGMVALASFNNPSGMEKVGNTAFRSTANSGLAQVGSAGSGGRGSLLGGSLEMSNVDLAQEFTNLIIAQRGFQANSRVITTSDQMLQDLVDLKR